MTEIKKYLTSLEVSYEIKENEDVYNHEFIAKIEKSTKQAKEGRVTKIKTENLWK